MLVMLFRCSAAGIGSVGIDLEESVGIRVSSRARVRVIATRLALSSEQPRTVGRGERREHGGDSVVADRQRRVEERCCAAYVWDLTARDRRSTYRGLAHAVPDTRLLCRS
mmetsp:Transcript_72635/g.151692  ORF Transcript_72635/g.151692 Transcript_72635/m.151692 type:complete len:110 (-) Transcript_72635:181-510(-)